MKAIPFAIAAAVAAAIFSLSAHAQTGRPSSGEVLSAGYAPHAAVDDQELGSYARYLMLNGATHDAAVAAARNVDHPAARKLVASQSRLHSTAPSSTHQ